MGSVVPTIILILKLDSRTIMIRILNIPTPKRVCRFHQNSPILGISSDDAKRILKNIWYYSVTV